MNWFKKNWFTISINIIVIFFILYITELLLYAISDKQYPFFVLAKDITDPKMSEVYTHLNNTNCIIDGIEKADAYRCPVGLNYKNKPIILFGCSFAWGHRLREKQTFYYKLSNLTKRPVYNRAACGWGIQHMLYQLRRDDFYSQVPKPEYVIYVYSKFQIARMYKYDYLFHNNDINDKYFYNYLKYNKHFGKLYEEKRFQYIPYLRIWNWLILPSIARIQENNPDKSFYLLEKHLIECRKKIDKHWGKDTKFIILDYVENSIPESAISFENIKRLNKNRIDVIRTIDLSNVDFYSAEYQISKQDSHPNEKAWDLITPLFVEKLKELK